MDGLVVVDEQVLSGPQGDAHKVFIYRSDYRWFVEPGDKREMTIEKQCPHRGHPL